MLQVFLLASVASLELDCQKNHIIVCLFFILKLLKMEIIRLPASAARDCMWHGIQYRLELSNRKVHFLFYAHILQTKSLNRDWFIYEMPQTDLALCLQLLLLYFNWMIFLAATCLVSFTKKCDITRKMQGSDRRQYHCMSSFFWSCIASEDGAHLFADICREFHVALNWVQIGTPQPKGAVHTSHSTQTVKPQIGL